MGSLATHLSAFLFLFPIGIRRLLCSYSLYLKSPSLYRAKTWYFTEPKWKNFDLYILLITLPIAAFSEIFWFLTFGDHPVYRFSFFQQAAVILLFWVVLVAVILRENFDLSIVHENVMFLFAAIAFLIEYSIVVGRGSAGLAGRSYELLAALSLICAGSCLCLSIQPVAFAAEVALSAGLVFKGTWILQSGLSLFSTTFLPKGCHKLSVLPSNDNSDVQCDLEEDGLRGVALINLLFVGHAIAVLILSFMLFGVLSFNQNSRSGVGTSSSAMEFDAENMLMRPLPEFEIE